MATPGELARKVAEAFPAGAESGDLLRRAVEEVATAAWLGGVMDERERCARLAETLEHVHPAEQSRGIPLNLREQIAAAIRGGRGP